MQRKPIPLGDFDCNKNDILNCSKPAHLETAAEVKISQHSITSKILFFGPAKIKKKLNIKEESGKIGEEANEKEDIDE